MVVLSESSKQFDVLSIRANLLHSILFFSIGLDGSIRFFLIFLVEWLIEVSTTYILSTRTWLQLELASLCDYFGL